MNHNKFRIRLKIGSFNLKYKQQGDYPILKAIESSHTFNSPPFRLLESASDLSHTQRFLIQKYLKLNFVK